MLNTAHYYKNANQNYNEVSSHMGKDGYHQKIHKQEMLERMGRKGHPLSLLVGRQTDTATMKNSMGIPLKPRNKATI